MMVMEAVICVIISFIIFLYVRRKRLNAPGPMGYPIIGNTLAVDMNNMQWKFDEWAGRYGDLFHVNILGRDIIVLNSVEIIREALLNRPNATILADRILGPAGKEYFYNYHDIGFSGWNEGTKKRRKLTHQLIKTYGEGLVAIERCIHQQLKITVSTLETHVGEALDPESMIDNFLLGVLLTLMTGRYHDIDSELVSILRKFEPKINLMIDPGIQFVMKLFPFLKHVPCQIATDHHECKDLQKKFFDTLKSEMESSEKSEGVYSALYAAKSSDGNGWITDNDIYGILADLFAAGFMTSKATMMALIHCLTDHPPVQSLIQSEVDKVIPKDRLPKLSDRVNMPYTQAVIMETLRLASIIPVPIPHRAMQNTTLRDVYVPKGTTILLNLWTVHHNKNVWKCPYEFIPDRFLDKSGNLVENDSIPMQNFLAFGVGKRSCVGELFAKGRIFLFLATMMKNFTFKPDDEDKFRNFDPWHMRSGIVRVPHNFSCKIEHRTDHS